MSETVQLPIRYHGGKQRIGPWIAAHLPPHRHYVEPFCGGSGVLFAKARSYGEVINDLDGDVVNFFEVLRDQPLVLAEAVELTPWAREEFVQSYKPAEDPIERARRFVVRSHMGFGSAGMAGEYRSGFRSNIDRPNSHPAMTWTRVPENLVHCSERLRGVVVENFDALEIIDRYDRPDTCYYLDPPYVHSTRRQGSDPKDWYDAYRFEMTDEDHLRLLKKIKTLRAAVVLSGYSTELYDTELEGWARHEKETQGSTHAGVGKRTEVLWCNRSDFGGLFSEGGDT